MFEDELFSVFFWKHNYNRFLFTKKTRTNSYKAPEIKQVYMELSEKCFVISALYTMSFHVFRRVLRIYSSF